MGLDTIFNSLLEILKRRNRKAEPPKKSIKKKWNKHKHILHWELPSRIKKKETEKKN
jgi:hypothetical protein